jgi:TIR domain/Pentapeptide repeats (8 copies)
VANPGHLRVVRRGAKSIRRWRDTHSVRLDLAGADLGGADLSFTDLSGANLREADLREANLREADLSAANLLRANLNGAHLSWAHLSRALLDGADLTRSYCDGTIFAEVDLSTVKGLETVLHHSPSTVGVDTLYLSKGKIPAEFLRGCGVPDGVIAYLPSLFDAERAALYYSCFISYSHKDEKFAHRLYSRMRDEHLRVWYAPADMGGGKKIYEEIERAILAFDKLLLVLSENSMSSDWVKTEIYKARQREIKENRRVLFPIRLVNFDAIRKWECFDTDTGKDLAREIREYFIPDFSLWPTDFGAGFARLLNDLRAEAPAVAKAPSMG